MADDEDPYAQRILELKESVERGAIPHRHVTGLPTFTGDMRQRAEVDAAVYACITMHHRAGYEKPDVNLLQALAVELSKQNEALRKRVQELLEGRPVRFTLDELTGRLGATKAEVLPHEEPNA